MQKQEVHTHRTKWLKLTIGVGAFLLLLLLPFDLPPSQRRLIAVLALTLTFWITEALPLPVTSLLAMVLCSLLGILPAKQSFASLGNPIIFLFLGAFLLAEAVSIHELDRRWIEWLLSKDWIARTPFRILVGFSIAAWGLSAWISNTAATATLYPLAWQTFRELKSRLLRPESFGVALMLICAYASSIGGIVTPVGTPPNLIGIGFLSEAGIHIGFLQWILTVAPIGVVMIACLMLMARLKIRLSLVVAGDALSFVSQRLRTPLTKGELNTLIAFGITIGLWVLSGIAALLLEQRGFVSVLEGNAPFAKQALSFMKDMPEAIPPLLGSILLFVLPAENGKPTMTWQQAQRIDWGTILLFAGGLTLGEAIFQTGLAKRIGEFITKLPFASTELGLTIWGTMIAIGLTEFVSNTAAANILTPIIIATAKEAQVLPILPVIGTVIGCSFAFMLPISTPPNAIVYSLGLVTIREMVLWGVVLDILGLAVIITMLHALAPVNLLALR